MSVKVYCQTTSRAEELKLGPDTCWGDGLATLLHAGLSLVGCSVFMQRTGPRSRADVTAFGESLCRCDLPQGARGCA